MTRKKRKPEKVYQTILLLSFVGCGRASDIYAIRRNRERRHPKTLTQPQRTLKGRPNESSLSFIVWLLFLLPSLPLLLLFLFIRVQKGSTFSRLTLHSTVRLSLFTSSSLETH